MLTNEQKKYLRKLAHDKKPVVWIGQAGLSDAVIDELDIALEHHELLKTKIQGATRELRKETSTVICDRLGCELVQTVGNILTLYRRKRRDAVIKLP